MTVNVDASFLCTQALIGHMTKQKWGRVINIGGLSAHIGAKERAHVVTSKAALIGLTKAISMEFLERGITCNCVVPGFIEDFDSKEKALTGHWLRHPQTPNLVLNRFGNPDEVAEVIANLCKKEADYINGQTLHVNGGSFTP
jgi:3-oxoacyl-[acyl-carrier protein] reductase